ncbi:hypothetical protein ACHAWO_007352 [Cyclotella atomus]|uniref:Uncharacterized protein n=1 Tax=Cyclotella atomus TaxID=382360 RepID=A0ABD3NNR7_9STRA
MNGMSVLWGGTAVLPAAASKSKAKVNVPDDSDASDVDDPEKQVYCILTSDGSADGSEGSPNNTNGGLSKYQELDRVVCLKMHARFTKRQSSADPNSFKSEQLHSILLALACKARTRDNCPRQQQVFHNRQSTSATQVPKSIQFTTKKRPGLDRVYDRMVSRNERYKMMDKDKSELDSIQKKQRKTAKRTTEALRKSANQKREIVQGILATDGVQLSQASAYVDGATINDNNFCSQNAVKYFRNGYESDSSDDDSKSKNKSK